MISDRNRLSEFEDELLRREPADRRRNLDIYEALYRQATAFGALPPANRLDGIEADIKLAERLNRV